MALGGALAGVASAAPASTEAPSIQGRVRYNGTVTCLPGTWSGDPVGFSYRWLLGGGPFLVGRDRVQVAGQRLRLNEPGVMNGNTLSCEVTATDAAGASATARSAAIKPAPGVSVMRLTKITTLPKGRVRIQGIVRPLVKLGPVDSGSSIVVRQNVGPNRFVQLSTGSNGVTRNGRFVVVATSSKAGRRLIQVDFAPPGNRRSLWTDAQVKRRVLFTKGGTNPFTVRAGR